VVGLVCELWRMVFIWEDGMAMKGAAILNRWHCVDCVVLDGVDVLAGWATA